MNEETQEHLTHIMDCFTGADGGISYIKFKTFLEVMDKQATDGDADAQRVINIVNQMGRMITIAEQEIGRE